MQQSSLGCLRARLSRYATTLAVVICGVLAHLLGGGIFWVVATPVQAASVEAVTSLPLPSSEQVSPIIGWLIFCQRYPDECTINPAESAVIKMTPAVWDVLVKTNLRVNRSIKAISDQEHWGVGDIWDYPADGSGDCEDFQLLKRKLLVGQGLPRQALRMTVVLDEDNMGHAVLMVRTDAGEFILDNKRDAILSPSRTGYLYVKREGDTGTAWVPLGGPSPVTTANQ